MKMSVFEGRYTEGGSGSTSSKTGLLSQGSTGESVRELQKKLTDLGYDVGGVDGIFGPKTAAALKKFQKDAGIQVDAIAGPQTWGALASAQATKPSAPPSSSPPSPAPATNQGGGSKPKQTSTSNSGGGGGSVPAGGGGGGGYATSPSQSSGLEGYIALQTQNLNNLQTMLSGLQEMYSGAMAPYEDLIREYMNKQPAATQLSDAEIRRRAEEMAALAVGGQRTSIQQQLEQMRQQAASQQAAIDAAYAGSEEAVNRALAEARRQATESAIARGGGRGGQVDYFSRKLQEPIMTGFQQSQAQRAAAIADIQNALSLAERQAAQRLEQLGQMEGQLTSQQIAALRDADYARAMQAWQSGLAGAMGLAQLGGAQNQFNANYALSLLPYLALTEAQRQALPLDWAQMMGQVPESGPGPITRTSRQTSELVPVRAYAASAGKGNAVDWDEEKRQVIVNGVRIPLDELKNLGGYVKDGVSYLPKNILSSMLGVS